MKIIKVDKLNFSKGAITEIANHFLRGEAVAYPTDTIYGLGCVASDARAVERVARIKRRAEGKSFIVLMKSFCMVHDYCFVSKKQDALLREYWAPRSSDLNRLETLPNKEAITVVLKSRGQLKHLESEDGKLAVRIPKDRFLLDLLKKINQPIVSTSLNVSGSEPINDVADIASKFGDELPDLVIDVGKITNRKPSKLLDMSDMSNIKKIR